MATEMDTKLAVLAAVMAAHLDDKAKMYSTAFRVSAYRARLAVLSKVERVWLSEYHKVMS